VTNLSNAAKSSWLVLDGQTPGSASITNAASEVLPRNPQRRGLILTNRSATEIFIAIGETAQASKGIVLGLNGSLVMNADFLSTEAISIVTASGASTVTYQEFH